MKKSVHPLVAIGAVLFFGSLMGLKVWCDHRYLSMDRLWGIKFSPPNEIVIRLGNELIFNEINGGHSHTVSLAEFGITEPHGDIAFFSNGDLLTVHSVRSSTFVEDLRVFLRLSEPETKGEDSRLQRCSFEDYRCHEFGYELTDFPRSFYLYIDGPSQHVYIADTGRHQLWLLDSEGHLIAKRGGFKFPNQLMIKDDALWVADTNHHQIRMLQADVAQFGEVMSHHDVFLKSPHIWPFAFAPVNNQWWVLLADNGMANARLAIYDAKWEFIRTLPLAEDADPVALTVVNDRVMIVDNRHFRIYQFDVQANALPDFTPAGIDHKLRALKATAKQWKLYSHMALAAFFVTFAIAFAFALRQHYADKREEQSQTSSQTVRPPVPKELIGGIWVKPKLFLLISPYLALLLPGLLSYLVISSKKPIDIDVFVTIAAFSVFAILIAIPMRRLINRELRFFPDRVEVITCAKKHYTTSHKDLLWSTRAILVGEVTIPLGKQGGASIYPTKMLERYLRPFLLPENKLNDRQMMRYQWKSEDGLLKYSMTLLVLFFALYIFLKLSR